MCQWNDKLVQQYEKTIGLLNSNIETLQNKQKTLEIEVVEKLKEVKEFTNNAVLQTETENSTLKQEKKQLDQKLLQAETLKKIEQENLLEVQKSLENGNFLVKFEINIKN